MAASRIRRESVATGKVGRFVAVVMIGLCIAIAWPMAGEVGINWDEPVHSIHGYLVRDCIASLGADRRCDEFLNLKYYGPLVDLIPAVLHPTPDAGRFHVRHFFCALLALATLAATFSFGKQMGDRRVALFAVVALVAMPRFVGHAFHNLKDIPFALAIALFMNAATQMVLATDLRWRRIVALGLSIGFVLSVRPGGLPLVMLLLLGVLFIGDVTRPDRWRRGAGNVGSERTHGRLLPRVMVAFAIGYGLMLLPWPYAWSNPILHPLEAMAMAQKFHFSPNVLFEGEVMRSVELPRRYLVEFLAITLPPSILFLAGIGLIVGVRRVVRRRWSRSAAWALITTAWLFVPLVSLTVLHPNLYDGMRHALFLLPPVALLAGLGAVAIAKPLGRWGAVVAWGVPLALLALPMVDTVRLHPYSMTYFNRFVGGVGGAAERFETDYWVLSYREAFAWVRDDVSRRGEDDVTVWVAGSGYLRPLAQCYAGEGWAVDVIDEVPMERELPAGVDYLIATSRFGYARDLYPESPIVHSVGRDGAVFSVVRRR